MTGGYDAGYQKCECFWGTSPGSLVQDLLSLTSVDGMRVLDAGCGEGKNSIALARKGAIVTAIDVSPLAIAHAQRLSECISGVSYRVADIRGAHFSPNSFEIVIAYGLLHCCENEQEVRSVVQMLQAATKPGGYFVLCAFNDRHQELEAHPGFSPTTVEHERYVKMFQGWGLVRCCDSDLTEVHPHNGIRHMHSMTRILARKEKYADLP